MKRGIEALIAGSTPEQIQNLLETELSCIEQTTHSGQKNRRCLRCSSSSVWNDRNPDWSGSNAQIT